MSLESVIYSRLSGYAGLTALVSTRIFPDALPPDVTYPAVSFWRSGPSRPLPAMGSDPALLAIPLQVDCWAQNTDPGQTSARTAAQAIGVQVLAALQRWRSSGDGVQDTLVENMGLMIPEEFTGIMHWVTEFTVWYDGAN